MINSTSPRVTAARQRTVIAVGPLPPPFSGTTIAFAEVCDDLANRQIPCRIVNTAPTKAPEPGWRAMFVRLRDWVFSFWQLKQKVANEPNPVLYLMLGQAPGAFMRDVVCCIIGRASGAMVVGHVHGGYYGIMYESAGPLRRAAIRSLVRHLDRIVVLGEGLRSMFSFAPEVSGRIHVIRNGLPVDGWLAQRPRELSTGPTRLLFLSNLIESKGYLELLRAAALLGQRGYDVHVHLAGEFRSTRDDRVVRSVAHARQLFHETLTELSLEDRVTYHGSVSGDEKRRILEQADIFVLPTRYRFEGQPIAIIEALAAGIPVISTSYRAIPDLIDDGTCGALIERPEPELIADAVEGLLIPEVYAQASRAALDKVGRELTASRFLAEVRKVLEVG